jgi:4-amino-4-deoxy-L-arabinose transferase-like glycosyltransferase
MNFYQLGQNGFGNLYYAAAIRSMLDSWHNFLFVSFDPGGFVSIDKPPLRFWLQAASAKVFGFTPFSMRARILRVGDENFPISLQYASHDFLLL